MSLMYLMQYAEGPECEVDALISNHIDGFVRQLLETKEVQRAQEDIRANPDTKKAILSRMDKLLPSESGENEDHPYDAAIATYLFVLSVCSVTGLREAMSKLRNNPRDDMPWTAMMCSWVLKHRGPSAPSIDTNDIEGELSSSESGTNDITHDAEGGLTFYPDENMLHHW